MKTASHDRTFPIKRLNQRRTLMKLGNAEISDSFFISFLISYKKKLDSLIVKYPNIDRKILENGC
jgi:hypothetical protein